MFFSLSLFAAIIYVMIVSGLIVSVHLFATRKKFINTRWRFLMRESVVVNGEI